jgi:hypothetical protein
MQTQSIARSPASNEAPFCPENRFREFSEAFGTVQFRGRRYAWAEFNAVITFFGRDAADQARKGEPYVAEWATEHVAEDGRPVYLIWHVQQVKGREIDLDDEALCWPKEARVVAVQDNPHIF